MDKAKPKQAPPRTPEQLAEAARRDEVLRQSLLKSGLIRENK